MNKAVIITFACCLLASCSNQSNHGFNVATPPHEVSFNTQAMASGQSIACVFDAKVIRVTPGKATSRGYVIDDNPRWVLELEVLPHDKKIPFQPGKRECYVADIKAVFGATPEDVSGVYRFSYTWNRGVPGKPRYENFKAKKVQNK